jgi:hypothetical protein
MNARSQKDTGADASAITSGSATVTITESEQSQ